MSDETGVTYEVEYLYYQYNSGQADNGHYRRRKEFKSPEQAKAFAMKVEDSAAKRLSEEEDHEFVNEVMDYLGYFVAGQTRVLKVTRQLVA